VLFVLLVLAATKRVMTEDARGERPVGASGRGTARRIERGEAP